MRESESDVTDQTQSPMLLFMPKKMPPIVMLNVNGATGSNFFSPGTRQPEILQQKITDKSFMVLSFSYFI